jgi:hypothetical protein
MGRVPWEEGDSEYDKLKNDLSKANKRINVLEKDLEAVKTELTYVL